MKPTGLFHVLPIAGMYMCRMLGLFLLIPVFTLYANKLTGATPVLIGIALGAYGLSQGALQIPFGLLSDKFGRKPMILLGLIMLATGSVIGALSHSIYGMIAARVLQGMGAIGSVLMALVSDVTPESKRTPAMAMIGGSIGFSFNLALIVSPIMTHAYGLSGLFWLTFALALLGMLLLTQVKSQDLTRTQYELKFKAVFLNRALTELNLSIFFQHAIFTATFFALPFYVKAAVATPWHFYLPTLCIAFLIAVPLLMMFEKKHKTRHFYLACILMMALAQIVMSRHEPSFAVFCGVMFMYFLAFNALEALLPSMVSKTAPEALKGTAMGVYSSSQFLGIFAGGSLAGLVATHFSLTGVFAMNAILATVWLGLMAPKVKSAY